MERRKSFSSDGNRREWKRRKREAGSKWKEKVEVHAKVMITITTFCFPSLLLPLNRKSFLLSKYQKRTLLYQHPFLWQKSEKSDFLHEQVKCHVKLKWKWKENERIVIMMIKTNKLLRGSLSFQLRIHRLPSLPFLFPLSWRLCQVYISHLG